MATSNVFESLFVDNNEQVVLDRKVEERQSPQRVALPENVVDMFESEVVEEHISKDTEKVNDEKSPSLTGKKFVYTREELIKLCSFDYDLPADWIFHKDSTSKEVIKPFFLLSHNSYHYENRGGQDKHARGRLRNYVSPNYRSRNEHINSHSRFAHDHTWESDNLAKIIGSLPELTSRIQDGDRNWKSNRYNNRREEYRPNRSSKDRGKTNLAWEWVANCNEWYYRDMRDKIQGPWKSSEMNAWLCHFQPTLKTGTKDMFYPLGDILIGFNANPFQPSESLEQISKRFDDCAIKKFLVSYLSHDKHQRVEDVRPTEVKDKIQLSTGDAETLTKTSHLSPSAAEDVVTNDITEDSKSSNVEQVASTFTVLSDQQPPVSNSHDNSTSSQQQTPQGESIDISEVFSSLSISNNNDGVSTAAANHQADSDTLSGHANFDESNAPSQALQTGSLQQQYPSLSHVRPNKTYANTVRHHNLSSNTKIPVSNVDVQTKLQFQSLNKDNLPSVHNDWNTGIANEMSFSELWSNIHSPKYNVFLENVQKEPAAASLQKPSQNEFGVNSTLSNSIQSEANSQDLLPKASMSNNNIATNNKQPTKRLSLLEIQKEEMKRNSNLFTDKNNFMSNSGEAVDPTSKDKMSKGWNKVYQNEGWNCFSSNNQNWLKNKNLYSSEVNKKAVKAEIDEDEFPVLGGKLLISGSNRK